MAYCITKIPKPPKAYGRSYFIMEPKEILKVPLKMTFTKWGELNKEEIEDILAWIYKDPEDPSPLLV